MLYMIYSIQSVHRNILLYVNGYIKSVGDMKLTVAVMICECISAL